MGSYKLSYKVLRLELNPSFVWGFKDKQSLSIKIGFFSLLYFYIKDFIITVTQYC